MRCNYCGKVLGDNSFRFYYNRCSIKYLCSVKCITSWLKNNGFNRSGVKIKGVGEL